MKDFDEPGSLAPTGLYLAGSKYMVIQGESGAVIRGKKVYVLVPDILLAMIHFDLVIINHQNCWFYFMVALIHIMQYWIHSPIIRLSFFPSCQRMLNKCVLNLLGRSFCCLCLTSRDAIILDLFIFKNHACLHSIAIFFLVKVSLLFF